MRRPLHGGRPPAAAAAVSAILAQLSLLVPHATDVREDESCVLLHLCWCVFQFGSDLRHWPQDDTLQAGCWCRFLVKPRCDSCMTAW